MRESPDLSCANRLSTGNYLLSPQRDAIISLLRRLLLHLIEMQSSFCLNTVSKAQRIECQNKASLISCFLKSIKCTMQFLKNSRFSMLMQLFFLVIIFCKYRKRHISKWILKNTVNLQSTIFSSVCALYSTIQLKNESQKRSLRNNSTFWLKRWSSNYCFAKKLGHCSFWINGKPFTYCKCGQPNSVEHNSTTRQKNESPRACS